ncbi:hypothetical protein ACFWNK_36320 [Streptomyces sp. NPDC058417]|uniref:hypothetical protein n=1 Tax=unclassified Streptomyces TaxID=2593676 RepID=UPI00364C4E92
MFRRREPVPFAFPAEADRAERDRAEADGFRGNVTPPPRERSSAGETAGRWLLGVTIVAALVGSLVIGMPALSLDHSARTQPSQAADGR